MGAVRADPSRLRSSWRAPRVAAANTGAYVGGVGREVDEVAGVASRESCWAALVEGRSATALSLTCGEFVRKMIPGRSSLTPSAQQPFVRVWWMSSAGFVGVDRAMRLLAVAGRLVAPPQNRRRSQACEPRPLQAGQRHPTDSASRFELAAALPPGLFSANGERSALAPKLAASIAKLSAWTARRLQWPFSAGSGWG